MFEKILECPICKKRFHYEHEGKDFPAFITCPECSNASPFQDFDALVFCGECRCKIKVPLEYLYEPGLQCPQCSAVLMPEELSDSADAQTIAGPNTSSAPFSRQTLRNGDFFDKYQIIKLLGRGGMAEVYLAEHLLLKQRCALKLMRSNLEKDDPVFIKRFIREAKLTHQLTHPNIVRVFDAGSDFKTGYLFIAMEYVEGCTLDTLTQQQDFSEEELLDVMRAVANALQQLTQAHVVHRDIKPSNIMYSYKDSQYKLMDLGIAKSDSNHQAGEMTLTMDQCAIGTPGFASPEQCNAAHNADIRSDIYSLGVTIYHTASKVMPFEGPTPVATIIKVLQEEAPPLKLYRPDLSAAFLNLIARMMAKDPDLRPQTVERLLEEIDKVAHTANASLLEKTWDTVQLKIKEFPGTLKQFPWRSPWKLLQQSHFRILLYILLAFHFGFFGLAFLKDHFRSPLPKAYLSYWQRYKGGITFPGELYRQWKISQARKKWNALVKQWKRHQAPLVWNADSEKEFSQLPLLESFPDELGNASPKKDIGTSRILYPLVKCNFSALLSSQITARAFFPSYTSAQVRTIRSQEFLSVPFNSTFNEYKKEGHQYIAADRLPARGMTLSASYRFPYTKAGLVSIKGLVSLFFKRNKLNVIFNGRKAVIPFDVLFNQWVDITLSVDFRKKSLLILSGDRLLGHYRLHTLPEVSKIALVLGSLHRPFAGEMANFRFTPNPLEAQLVKGHTRKLRTTLSIPGNFELHSITWIPPVPSPAAVNKPPQKSPSPAVRLSRPQAPVVRKAPPTPPPELKELPPHKSEAIVSVLEKWQNLNNSGSIFQKQWSFQDNPAEDKLSKLLRENKVNQTNKEYYTLTVKKWQNELEKLRSTLPKEYWNERRLIVGTARELAQRWSERCAYLDKRNGEIREAMQKKYDPEATRRIQDEVFRYTSQKNDWGYNHRDIEFGQKLAEMLKNPAADPNMELRDGRYPDYNGTPLKTLLNGRFQAEEQLIQVLIKRRSSPADIRPFIYRQQREILIQYGLPTQQAQKMLDNMLLKASAQEEWLSAIATLLMDGAQPTADHLSQAILQKKRDFLVLFLAFGADPNQPDKNGETPLFNTYRIPGGSSYRRLLMAAGADPAIRNREGKRPSDFGHIATFMTYWNRKDFESIRKALKSGIDVNTVLGNGDTLLQAACRNADPQMVKLLLELGADPNKESGTGWRKYTPLAFIVRESRFRNHRNLQNIAFMLIKANSDLRKNPPGYGGASLNILWSIISHYNPAADILISEALKHTDKFTSAHWSSIAYEIASRRIQPKTKTAIAEALPGELSAKYAPRWCINNLKLTVPIIEKIVQTPEFSVDKFYTESRRFSNGSKSHTYRGPLLYFLVLTHQSPDVIETLLKAGADPTWKTTEKNIPLTQITRDPKVRSLLLKYSRSGRQK